MPESEKNHLAEKLQKLIETVDVANIMTEPLTSSLKHLLEMSAADLNSAAASILVRDGADGDLRFLTAIGQVAEQLLRMRVPSGKGIAGFVMSSGQPMAVADVGEEQSFYAEVDKATGYSTQTILATPLRYNDDVIGVLEYINRGGDGPFEPFSPDDMDKAAQFAEPIASLVNAYESAKVFRELGDKMIASDGDPEIAEIREWLAGLRDSAEHREMMDLAVLVREIASRGPVERQMCREILEAVQRFSKSSSDGGYLSY